jgi:2-dehydro-3-deoxy-D-arabinonate dehydratase
MRIIRYLLGSQSPALAAVNENNQVYALPYHDFMYMVTQADKKSISLLQFVQGLITDAEPLVEGLEQLELLAPIEAPEVWAAGVTYERSRAARNYEATAGKLDASTFYDKVYDAKRPEIFMKSTPSRTVGPNKKVHLRSDSNWQIPEPELALVLDSNGTLLGYTAGNDMSCRDIEGENPLYLPQAKMWSNSCSIGPAILLADAVSDPYSFEIQCRIFRDDQLVVEGSANTRQLKRKLEELIAYLILDNAIPDGTVLLTGTCIVPPNDFTLRHDDRIEIEISGIGVLTNTALQL